MLATCPNCGAEVVVVNTSGRKNRSIPFVFILDALQGSTTVRAAIKKLEVSPGWLYKTVENPRQYLVPKEKHNYIKGKMK